MFQKQASRCQQDPRRSHCEPQWDPEPVELLRKSNRHVRTNAVVNIIDVITTGTDSLGR